MLNSVHLKRFFVFAPLVLSAISAKGAELVLQKAPAGQLMAVAINADASAQATSSLGDPIKIWRPRTGVFVRDLPDSRDELALAWSPDGKILLSAARDTDYAMPRSRSGVRVRTMPSGRVLCNLPTVKTPLWFDGRIIRTTDGGTVSDWRLSDGKEVANHPLQPVGARAATLEWNGNAPHAILAEGSLEDGTLSRYFAFSRDGKRLIFGGASSDQPATVWNALNGHFETSIQDSEKAFGLAAVSNDGKFAVTQGEDPNWSEPGSDESRTEAAYARTFQLHLWDLKRQRIVASWPGYYSLYGGVQFLRFARDGQRVFCGGEGRSEIRAVPSGKLIRTINANGFQDISDDDRVWAWGYIHQISTRSVVTGKPLANFPGFLGGVSARSWSPDGRFLAAGAGSELFIWDVAQARLLKRPEKAVLYFNRARWIDALTLETENSEEASIWKIDAAKGIFRLEKQIKPNFPQKGYSDYYSHGVFLSPNTQKLLSNSNQFEEKGTLYLWDETGHKLLRKIQIRDAEESSDNFRPFWLKDSVHFLVETRRGIEVWNADTGILERTMEAPASWPRPVGRFQNPLFIIGVSPDGEFLAANDFYQDGKRSGAGIWDISSGQFVRSIPSGAASWSFDNAQLAIENTLWSDWKNADKARLTLSQNSLGGNIFAPAAWSPDGQRVAIGATDAIFIYQTRDGRDLGRLAIGGNSEGNASDDWLVWNRDGFFNAPDRGRARVRWRENGALLLFDSPRDRILRRKFFQPQKVRSALLARTIPAR